MKPVPEREALTLVEKKPKVVRAVRVGKRKNQSRSSDQELGGQVGSLIREERLRLGMSLTKLAATCGTSPSHISCIELGKTSPTLYTIDRIAKALQVEMELPSGKMTSIALPERKRAKAR